MAERGTGDRLADVLPLFPAGDEAEDLIVQVRKNQWCAHKRLTLDRRARRVHCRACGSEIDAFEALDMLTRAPQQYLDQLNELKRRTRVATANLAELLKDERNAKSRKKRRDDREQRSAAGAAEA